MGYYTKNQIYPWLYSFKGYGSVYWYLAVGSEKALLFDTGYGIGDMHEAVREVTDKPLSLVLGHGHVDHINGAFQFDEAWLHEADFNLCKEHSSEAHRLNVLSGLEKDAEPKAFSRDAYVSAGMCSLKKLEIGQIFDLGGLHMEVVAMEGHTAGSVGLLAQEERVLLDSDSANPHIWMYLPEALSLSSYIAMLERTIKIDFDTFITGHSDVPLPKSEFNKYIRVAKNANIKEAEPYEVIPGTKGLFYQEDGVGIVFSERTLKGKK